MRSMFIEGTNGNVKIIKDLFQHNNKIKFLAPTGALGVQILDLCVCVHLMHSSILWPPEVF